MSRIVRILSTLSRKCIHNECLYGQSFLKVPSAPASRCFHLSMLGANNVPNWQLEYVGATQHTLQYATATAEAEKCWNCGRTKELKSHMICALCGHLQDVDNKINYFHLLNSPQNFGLQPEELTKTFRELQKLVHPDKFSNRKPREQLNSANWSSLINKAYKTLLTPMERGEYILKLNGLIIANDNSEMNKELLYEMLERNIELEDAKTKEDVERLNVNITVEIDKYVEQLNGHFTANSLEQAKTLLIHMKYLTSLQNKMKQKLLTMTTTP